MNNGKYWFSYKGVKPYKAKDGFCQDYKITKRAIVLYDVTYHNRYMPTPNELVFGLDGTEEFFVHEVDECISC